MKLRCMFPLLLVALAAPPMGAQEGPYPAPEPGERLTPPEGAEPSINGAGVVGLRSGAFPVEVNPHGCSLFRLTPADGR